VIDARLALIALAVVGVAGEAAAAPIQQPVARHASKGRPIAPDSGVRELRSGYTYVTYRQVVTDATGGAGATIFQADPALGLEDAHSLAEIAVQSADFHQIVEIGWTVDLEVNDDLQPHLFVYHWVDSTQSCYNGCGWVQISPNKRPGMRVEVGQWHRYEIKLIGDDWWLLYDSEPMGYFPGTLWGQRFHAAGVVQWFGEVGSRTDEPCAEMGNGERGDAPSSAAFDDLHLFDASGAAVTAVGQRNEITRPELFDIGRTSITTFGFGGPGATTGCCKPMSCAAVGAECGALADPACPDHVLECGVCSEGDTCVDHQCALGLGPRDDGDLFIGPPLDGRYPAGTGPDAGDALERPSGGCCAAHDGSAGHLVLAAVVAGLLGRRRRPR